MAGRGNNGGGSSAVWRGVLWIENCQIWGCVRKFDGMISWLAVGWSHGELNSAVEFPRNSGGMKLVTLEGGRD